MWVDYRGPLSTVYNDGEISTCGWIIEVHSVQSIMMEHLSALHCFTNSLRASMIIFPSAILNSLKAPFVDTMISIEIVRIVWMDNIQQYIPVQTSINWLTLVYSNIYRYKPVSIG